MNPTICICPAVHRSIYHDLPNGKYVSIRISFLSEGNVSLLQIIICVCKPHFFFFFFFTSSRGSVGLPVHKYTKAAKNFMHIQENQYMSCFIFSSFSIPPCLIHISIYIYSKTWVGWVVTHVPLAACSCCLAQISTINGLRSAAVPFSRCFRSWFLFITLPGTITAAIK